MTRTERATQMLRAVGHAAAPFPFQFNRWVGTIPTTQLKVLVAAYAVLGTAHRYWWGNGWTPSPEWLLFLAGLLADTTLQFHSKRKTQRPGGAGEDPAEPPNGGGPHSEAQP